MNGKTFVNASPPKLSAALHKLDPRRFFHHFPGKGNELNIKQKLLSFIAGVLLCARVP